MVLRGGDTTGSVPGMEKGPGTVLGFWWSEWKLVALCTEVRGREESVCGGWRDLGAIGNTLI